ncbi:hypothetical protein ACFQ5X_48325 [Streptomyces kaempferi]|uniref:Beta-ketoacyl-[acyl-carrier-protein] synthase III N-terminal domain-containing protein n=1 Tax=Streptomyces kaempferi TaxID=333725 RepID=A0ABW3XWI0_9ACTN
MSNAQLCRELDTSDEWIRTRTGIRERRIADPGVSTADLAAAPALEALQSCGSSDVQALVLATTTPDHLMPETAPTVAARLGLTGIAAFDVAAVCTGFVYALATAAGLIAGGTAQRVLVIGADVVAHRVGVPAGASQQALHRSRGAWPACSARRQQFLRSTPESSPRR